MDRAMNGGDLRALAMEKIAGGRWSAVPDRPISGAAIDSRTILPGQLFVAIRTERDDGHRYLQNASRAGASAALVEGYRPEVPIPQLLVPNVTAALQNLATAHRLNFTGDVIAVAGSYGKTTVKELCRLLLGKEICHGTEANHNNALGVSLTVLGIDPARHRHAVVETGISHPGEMEIISKIVRAKHVIFTGISHKHGEFFPSQWDLLEEKMKIFDFVKSFGGRIVTADGTVAAAIGTRFRGTSTAIREGRDYTFHGESSTVTLRSPGRGLLNFALPRPSAGFAQSFALCHALVRHLGVGDGQIRNRLAEWRWPNLRGQIFRHTVRDCTYFVDCYNSDGAALLDSVATFHRLFPRGPRLLILSAMTELGNYSEQLHRGVGERLPFDRDDRFFFLGHETIPMQMALQARGLPPARLHFFTDKDELGRALAGEEGIFFLKGSRFYALETLVDFGRCQLVE